MLDFPPVNIRLLYLALGLWLVGLGTVPSGAAELARPDRSGSAAGSSASRVSARPLAVEGLVRPSECVHIRWIEVRKAERVLRAWCQKGGIVSFRAALGRNSTGAKRRSGDARTPEGVYRVAAQARPGRFHLFIPLDYPSTGDATHALERGLISEATYEQILDAHSLGDLPPQDTELGGAVGIHGEGRRHRGQSSQKNWTLGCIAVNDREIEFLAARIAPGVPVVIFP